MADWKTLLHDREMLLAVSLPFEVRVDGEGTRRHLTVALARDARGYVAMLGTTFDADEAGASPELMPLLAAMGRFADMTHYDDVDVSGVCGHGGFAERLREASSDMPSKGGRLIRTVLEFAIGDARAELVTDGTTLSLRGLGLRAWERVCSSQVPEALVRAVAGLLAAPDEMTRIALVAELPATVAALEDMIAAREPSTPDDAMTP